MLGPGGPGCVYVSLLLMSYCAIALSPCPMDPSQSSPWPGCPLGPWRGFLSPLGSSPSLFGHAFVHLFPGTPPRPYLSNAHSYFSLFPPPPPPVLGSVLGSPGTPVEVLGAADQNRHLDALTTSCERSRSLALSAAGPARHLTMAEKGASSPIPTTQLPSLHYPRTVRVVQVPIPCEGPSYCR